MKDLFANKFKETPPPVEVFEDKPIISDKVFLGFIIAIVLLGASAFINICLS